VRYRGTDLKQLTKKRRMSYRREVQPVFQDPYGIYNPFYRVDRVLEKPLHRLGLLSKGVSKQDVIEEALRAVDLRPGDILGRYPHQLSGGERQRLMLARLYLIKPKLIVADEAVSMIDMSLRAVFLNILSDFHQNLGISTLFISHNLATAHYLGGNIMVMCGGSVIEQGNLDTVIANPAHPYTRFLLEAIPSPDPRHRWSDSPDRSFVRQARTSTPVTESSDSGSCIYRGRCPQAMAICSEARPPMTVVATGQQVACHLYSEE
jgi:peptide/nickel transport system ATP-binding protein